METTLETQAAIDCAFCGENNVDFYCVCGKRICENCLGPHKKTYPTHCSYPIKEKPIFCEKHAGNICELFCEICCESICTVCSFTSHEGHSKSSMKSRLKSQRNVMEKELQKLERKFESSYVKLADDIDQKQDEVSAKYSSIRQEIEQTGLFLENKVKKAVKDMKMLTEDLEKKHIDCLRENKTKIEKIISDIEETKSDISKQLADNKQRAVYHTKAYPFEQCPNLKDRSLPVFHKSECEFNCFDFLGELTTSSSFHIFQVPRCIENREDCQERTKSIELLENVRLVQSIPTVYRYVFDIVFTKNNLILVCGSYRIKNSSTIRALDFDGKEIMLKHVKNQPNFLSQANDETIFYTSEGKQGLHRMRNESIETIIYDHSWKQKGLVCRSSGDIIVAEHNEMERLGRLCIYTSDGEKVQVIGVNLIKPTYVCVNNNSDICTSDEAKQMVFVFRSNGDLKFMYKGVFDKTNFTSFTPRGLAADCLCNVLIADYINHAIHVIDCEGQFLRCITKLVEFPTALSTDQGKRLLIGQYMNSSIQVLEYLNTA